MFLLPTDDMRKPDPFETRPQRLARQRRESAARQRARRARLAETRRPNSRQVDAAIADALAYVFTHGGTSPSDTRLRLGSLAAIAYMMLVAKGFSKVEAEDAVGSRIFGRDMSDVDWPNGLRDRINALAVECRS